MRTNIRGFIGHSLLPYQALLGAGCVETRERGRLEQSDLEKEEGERGEGYAEGGREKRLEKESVHPEWEAIHFAATRQQKTQEKIALSLSTHRAGCYRSNGRQ